MRSQTFFNPLIICSILAFTVVGCKKSPKTVTPIPVSSRPVNGGLDNASGPMDPGLGVPSVPDPSASGITETTLGGGGGIPLGPREIEGNYQVDRETFRSETVYFDFDRSNVKSSELGKVESVAAYLKNEPNTRLRVEGHCDERGTSEYNRALGERRALSIREYLAARGVSVDRVSTLSYGEDRPVDAASNEAAWRLNRRGEFILLRPRQ